MIESIEVVVVESMVESSMVIIVMEVVMEIVMVIVMVIMVVIMVDIMDDEVVVLTSVVSIVRVIKMGIGRMVECIEVVVI